MSVAQPSNPVADGEVYGMFVFFDGVDWYWSGDGREYTAVLPDSTMEAAIRAEDGLMEIERRARSLRAGA